MIESQKFSSFLKFVGKRTLWFGTGGIFVGFLSFGCDLALAMMLQRFFMASGLVTLGQDMPLGIALQSPMAEGAGLILLGIVRGAILWISGYLAGLCQINAEVEKRRELVEWAVSTGGQEVGSVMSYYNDIIIGTAAAIGAIFYFVSRFVVVFGIFVVMMTYSYQITFFVLCLIAVFAPLQMLIDKIISKNSKHIQSSLADSVSLLARTLKNNLFVSLHGLSNYEIENIKTPIKTYERSSIRYYSLNALRTSLPQILGLGSVVAIAIQGHVFFKDNPGTMIAYLYMVLRLFQTLSDSARVSGNLRLNFPRISILYQWWKNNINFSPIKTTQSLNETEIENGPVGWRSSNINFVWPNGKKTAILNLSFEIKPASTVLITGESGSGKTTLFHILLGLLKPSAGFVEIINLDGTTDSLNKRVNKTISYVGPDPFLIAGTVRDQLLIGNKSHNDTELNNILTMVGADFVLDFKDGLNHILTEQGQGLSAGQKQRISLARGLLRKPDILLLDEATANLDMNSEAGIVDLINNLRGKMTILYISHRPNENLKFDSVIDIHEKG